MAFVRRQRTYYKDGVEIPESSITDFGRTAYYKNIVTTKYWKEITTGSRELEYACYHYGGNMYYYAKTPLGSDMTRYFTASGGLANSSNDVTGKTANGWTSVGEEAAVNDMYYSNPRYRDGDLYIDTTVTETIEGTPEDYTYTTEETVTIEVTAGDDYDYTKFVPSTQFDSYEDSNKLYNLIKRPRKFYNFIRTVRTYYKYDGTKSFVQPILSSNGIMGGTNFAVSSNVAQLGDNDVYTLFNNTAVPPCFHSVQGAITGYIDLYNPNPLNITNILVNNQNSGYSKNRASTAGNIYGSDNGSDWELITSYTNTVQGINAQWNISLSSNNKYYKYYRLESTACGSGGYWTIGELTITAQERVGVESSAEDADYYIDTNKIY